MSDGMEAEPYMDIEFIVIKGHGTQISKKVNCGVNIAIAGLKEDLAHEFGIPHTKQDWYLRQNIKLSNNNTLLYYDVGADLDALIQITVKST